jgi:hypothetical protein
LGFRDRKVGLVFFGLAQIAFGAILGLVGTFQVLMSTVPLPELQEAGAAAPAGSGLVMAALLAPPAVTFLFLGYGSIKARRWARALSLVVGWLWSIMGVAQFIWMVFFLPSFTAAMREAAPNPGMTPEEAEVVLAVVRIVVIAFYFIVLVVLPATLVLFYRSPHVKATCESIDLETRWTDRCPLPVLALVLLMAFGAYQGLAFGIFMPYRLFPLFGVLVRGFPAAVLMVGFGAALAYLARGIYRLEKGAWNGSFGLFLLGLSSAVITFLRVAPDELYSALRLPEGQVESLLAFMPGTSTMALLLCLWGAVLLSFLWYLRRYFENAEIPSLV